MQVVNVCHLQKKGLEESGDTAVDASVCRVSVPGRAHPMPIWDVSSLDAFYCSTEKVARTWHGNNLS